MLLNHDTLRRIEAGTITLAFRKWRRPTVKAGGTLLTSIGRLAIEAVDVVRPEDITDAEARAAGYDGAGALRAWLRQRAEGDVYRVRLALAGPDPRIELRSEVPDGAGLDALVRRLEAMGRRSRPAGWPFTALALIAERPGVRAGDLAVDMGMARADFKANVRKLKKLGLTESLKVGYRLSPRGAAVFRHARDRSR